VEVCNTRSAGVLARQFVHTHCTSQARLERTSRSTIHARSYFLFAASPSYPTVQAQSLLVLDAELSPASKRDRATVPELRHQRRIQGTVQRQWFPASRVPNEERQKP
jgi:hypothetical protein